MLQHPLSSSLRRPLNLPGPAEAVTDRRAGHGWRGRRGAHGALVMAAGSEPHARRAPDPEGQAREQCPGLRTPVYCRTGAGACSQGPRVKQPRFVQLKRELEDDNTGLIMSEQRHFCFSVSVAPPSGQHPLPHCVLSVKVPGAGLPAGLRTLAVPGLGLWAGRGKQSAEGRVWAGLPRGSASESPCVGGRATAPKVSTPKLLRPPACHLTR